MLKNILYQNTARVADFARENGTPLYVYNSEIVSNRFAVLREALPEGSAIHYACKANYHEGILRLLKSLGSRIEAVSRGEVELALRIGFSPSEVAFTCSNIEKAELEFVARTGIVPNLDSLEQVRKWGELRPGSKISVRINQGIGSGHHAHVITGGPESKFGVYHTQIDEIKSVANQGSLQIVGLHQHIGSNVLDEGIFLEAVEALLATAKNFPNLEFLDFGGGFGVPYRPEEKHMNYPRLGSGMKALFENFFREYGSRVRIIFEPGRFLVAEAGVLLVQVTEVKRTPFKTFVGVNSGFNHLIRPAMYDSYHEIVNVSNPEGRTETVSIAGNVCESGDLFARDREIPECREGDILAILNAGAYGFTMASDYNLRPKPRELFI